MEETKKEESKLRRVFSYVFAVIRPILPGMLGTGMVKVLLILCSGFGVMHGAIFGAIGGAVTIVVTFVLSYMMMKDMKDKEENSEKTAEGT